MLTCMSNISTKPVLLASSSAVYRMLRASDQAIGLVERWFLPFKLDWIQGTLVVCRSRVGGSCWVYLGLSENSVPLHPMVNDHYPVFKWLFHWEYTPFSDIPTLILQSFGLKAADHNALLLVLEGDKGRSTDALHRWNHMACHMGGSTRWKPRACLETMVEVELECNIINIIIQPITAGRGAFIWFQGLLSLLVDLRKQIHTKISEMIGCFRKKWKPNDGKPLHFEVLALVTAASKAASSLAFRSESTSPPRNQEKLPMLSLYWEIPWENSRENRSWQCFKMFTVTPMKNPKF